MKEEPTRPPGSSKLSIEITVAPVSGTWRVRTAMSERLAPVNLADEGEFAGHELTELRNRIVREMWDLLALEEQRARAQGLLPPR